MSASIHALANPKRFMRLSYPIVVGAITIFAILVMVTAIWALFLSPPDYQQGDSVRIMYVHVPSAWLALGAYTTMSLASATYLIWRHPVAALAAKAAALPGLVLTLTTLVTGSIWGKPMWGAWWVWDARLTSMLVLLFIYIGYLALWRAVGDPARAMRPTAIYCLIGAINLPIIKFSVDWWNTLHQPASVLRLGGPSIHPSLLYPLLAMAATFLAYFLAVWLLGIRTEIRRTHIRAIRASRSFAPK